MLHSFYDGAHSHEDLPQILRDQIGHFFQHYKDLEPGKWAKVTWWDGSRTPDQRSDLSYKKSGEKCVTAPVSAPGRELEGTG